MTTCQDVFNTGNSPANPVDFASAYGFNKRDTLAAQFLAVMLNAPGLRLDSSELIAEAFELAEDFLSYSLHKSYPAIDEDSE